MEMSPQSCRLPQLVSRSPRYHGMPRRYEETKPVTIQDFTHKKIVEIGHDIQRRLLLRLETEKSEAIQAAETAVWEKAEKTKQNAIKQVHEDLEEKIEKALELQQKEHEQKIKEEIMRVEMAMQKTIIEQVQIERARGEKLMAEAIEHVRETCAQEMERALTEAHREEQHIAANNIKNLTQKYTAVIEDLKIDHAARLVQALTELTVEKDQEMEEAVIEAHEYEKKEAEIIVDSLKEKHEAQLAEEAIQNQGKEIEIERLNRRIEELQKEKDRLAEFLGVTRVWFQDFIDRMQKVKKGEADFILPPAYLDEIEKGLMIAQ